MSTNTTSNHEDLLQSTQFSGVYLLLTLLDSPKQIYTCDSPGCGRWFVRQDLCTRHKDRHTAKSSQSSRKDSIIHAAASSGSMPYHVTSAALPLTDRFPPGGAHNPDVEYKQAFASAGGTLVPADKKASMHSPSSMAWTPTPVKSERSPPTDHQFQSPTSDAGSVKPVRDAYRRSSDDAYQIAGAMGGYSSNSPHTGLSSGFSNVNLAASQNRRLSYSSRSSPSTAHRASLSSQPPQALPMSAMPKLDTTSALPQPASSQMPYQYSSPQTSFSVQDPKSAHATFQAHNSYSPYQKTPYSGFNSVSEGQAAPAPVSSDPSTLPAASAMTQPGISMGERNVSEAALQELSHPCAIPMFADGYSRSPLVMADDFTAWLFGQQIGTTASATSQSGFEDANLAGSVQFGLHGPFFAYDSAVSGYYNQQPIPAQHLMAVSSILESSSLRESLLSEERRKQLLDLITSKFKESDQKSSRGQKDILDGNLRDDDHILSLEMMQGYIASYWVHIHPQMPILHRPTFCPAACAELLLLAMMALGAATLENGCTIDTSNACAKLATRLAWHLRSEIFRDPDFRPPAKLWIFQALLLLELFEKLYSTRPLHELAHIHHATTLTLMRRGSSLIGRSASESPPSGKDGRPGSAITAGVHNGPTDDWWDKWITNEATRRAAFAAFLLDSTHATMFGHSAVMSAHELRLPLPCDEALWAATSSAEVGRVDAHLRASGFTPLTFSEGLKKIIFKQSVKTNCFGRTILMAGLLSVNWHMNQRDLQLRTLGVHSTLGGRDIWRSALTQAFDFWKQDFDNCLTKAPNSSSPRSDMPGYGHIPTGVNSKLDIENGYVLHHMAHMASHVDIVDVQIFAGAPRLLGRVIMPWDCESAQRRVKEQWAPTARARNATFYALRFLSQVLNPDAQPPSSPTGGLSYSARNDNLLNRPWVVYFATLTVFAYGYAMDGPLKSVYSLPTPQHRIDDMQRFFKRAAAISTPEDLKSMKDRNAMLGLLMLLRDEFGTTRWELLHEASNLLGKCIEMLMQSS